MYNIKFIYREFYARQEQVTDNNTTTPAQEAADAVMEYLDGMGIAKKDIIAIEALVNRYANLTEEAAFANGFKAAIMLNTVKGMN